MTHELHSLSLGSFFANASRLVAARDRAHGLARLGLRWSLGLPADESGLTEYALPASRPDYPTLMETRGGLRLRRHAGDSAGRLWRWLDIGRPAVVAVDCYYLPYRPAYGRVHSSRTILVRPGGRADEVDVEDTWLPAYSGPLKRHDLERAMFSEVPLDPRLEPFFAGVPLAGDWFEVELEPITPTDPAAWFLDRLLLLRDEALCSRTDSGGDHGIDQWPRFAERLGRTIEDVDCGTRRAERLRAAYLILRMEFSSRVFFAIFLAHAARALGDDLLGSACADYFTRLQALGQARDLVCKALASPAPGISGLVRTRLTEIHQTELRLARFIELCVGAARRRDVAERGPHAQTDTIRTTP